MSASDLHLTGLELIAAADLIRRHARHRLALALRELAPNATGITWMNGPTLVGIEDVTLEFSDHPPLCLGDLSHLDQFPHHWREANEFDPESEEPSEAGWNAAFAAHLAAEHGITGDWRQLGPIAKALVDLSPADDEYLSLDTPPPDLMPHQASAVLGTLSATFGVEIPPTSPRFNA